MDDFFMHFLGVMAIALGIILFTCSPIILYLFLK